MSCGSNTCSPTNSSGDARHSAVETHWSWVFGLLARLGLMLERARHRQILIEFEKVRQRGIVMQMDDWLLTLEKHRQRQRLLDLDEHLLADIGLTRAQAEEIARRPFWR